jgi:hypothetical protein
MRPAAVESHMLDVDRDGVFRLLRETFSRSTTFLSELLQNGRRAGARQITVEWDPDQDILTVSDDGCGIRDFQSLFIACKSGWDPEIQFREHPFGVGLFAAIFASESVEIHSLDRHVTLDERLFQKCPIYVRAAVKRAGTQVRLKLRPSLRRATDAWRSVILALVKGFPIPVSFNGDSLSRPDALTQGLAFRTTPLGELYLERWQACDAKSFGEIPKLYYQGLPLRSIDAHLQNWSDVLHVDTRRFRPRSPDREYLHEADQNEPVIRQAIRAMWQERLIERRHELSPQIFVDTHWRHCIELQLPQLLQDMPLSVSMLKQFDGIRCVDLPYESANDRCGTWNSCRTVPARSDVLVEDFFAGGYDGNDTDPPYPLASLYAWRRQLAALDPAVPESHWAYDRTVDLLDPDLGLHYELLGPREPVPFEGIFGRCSVWLCEEYCIGMAPRPGCGIAPELLGLLVPVDISDHAFYDPVQQCLIVPSEACNLEDALLQVSNYCSEDEHFNDDDHERDGDRLRTLVAFLRAPSSPGYLTALLERVHPDVKMLGESWFRVRFDATKQTWEVRAE